MIEDFLMEKMTDQTFFDKKHKKKHKFFLNKINIFCWINIIFWLKTKFFFE